MASGRKDTEKNEKKNSLGGGGERWNILTLRKKTKLVRTRGLRKTKASGGVHFSYKGVGRFLKARATKEWVRRHGGENTQKSRKDQDLWQKGN